ncbi:MAG: DNA circularization N-terminal domain-containing protein [Hyphomicrobiales bacterium]
MSACRDWTSTLLPASFKGVGFEVERETTKGGRRIQTHEYISSESWDNEDIGRKAKTISVSGFVHGDLADVTAAALLAAGESIGPGLLILPGRVPSLVRCENVSSTFKKDDLGYMEVQFDFVVEPLGISGGIALGTIVRTVIHLAGVAITLSGSMHSRRYTGRTSTSVAQNASADGHRAAAGYASLIADGTRMTDVDAAPVRRDIQGMFDAADTYARQGERGNVIGRQVFVRSQNQTRPMFGDVFGELTSRLAENAIDPRECIEAMRIGANAEFHPDFRNNSNTSRQEQYLLSVIEDTVRRSAIAGLMVAMARFYTEGVSLVTKSRVINDRGLVADVVTPVIELIDDPETKNAFHALRDALIDLLTNQVAVAAQEVTVQSNQLMPSVYWSNFLYADASRAEELALRNDVGHPIMMPSTFSALVQ